MRRYERIMKAHPEIESWLKNRPRNTQKAFAENLMSFCKKMKIAPEEWRQMDKFQARDLAWSYVEPMIKERSSVAASVMSALKSWYRNLNGERLPFDSGRGGKHNIRVVAKKAVFERIPSKEEVYRIVDMVSSLRDKAILLTLFQSGIRVNALCSLKYGDVKDQLSKDIITLKITRNIDEKLRGTNIAYYITCLNGEAALTLRKFCEIKHKHSKAETPLFYTRNKKPVTYQWVWKMVKLCVARAGFDPKTIWVHSFRKAFRKIIRKADIDDDDKEQLMGHVIRGSRNAYFDRKDTALIAETYQKCDFSREVPLSEVSKLRHQLEDQKVERKIDQKELRAQLEKREQEIGELRGYIWDLQNAVQKLQPLINLTNHQALDFDSDKILPLPDKKLNAFTRAHPEEEEEIMEILRSFRSSIHANWNALVSSLNLRIEEKARLNKEKKRSAN